MDSINDVSLAMLEENVSALEQLASTVSAQLDAVSRNNTAAIHNLKPLLSQITKSRHLETNINQIYSKIGHIQAFNDRTFQVLQKMERSKDMDSLPQLEDYTNSMDQLDLLQSEMKTQNIKVFKGLRDALNKGYEMGEIELKKQLKTKLLQIANFQRDIVHGGDDSNLKPLEIQCKYIFQYLTFKRNLKIDDLIINERVENAISNVEDFKPVMPDIGNDQNDIYVGKDGKQFENFTSLLQQFMIQETNFISIIFKGNSSSVADLSSDIIDIYLNGYINGLNYIISQISRRKVSYCTMYYELALSTTKMVQWLNNHRIAIPDPLNSLMVITNNESLSTFKDFFNYASNLFQTSVKSSNPSLSSEFNMILNRLKKFEGLYNDQLHFITKFKYQEWLPAGFPKSFISLPSDQTDDPRLMLSTFYTDVIIWSFHLLDDKYKNDDSQMVGIMLLSNYDSATSMIENGNLRIILGQNGIDRISKLQKKALDKATASWSSLCAETMKASTITGDGNVNMSKTNLKSFIEMFNATLDNLCLNFKSNPASAHFSGALIQEIERTLLPVYSLFLTKVPPSTKHLMTLGEVKTKINGLKN